MKVVDDDPSFWGNRDDLVDKVFVDTFLSVSPDYRRYTLAGNNGHIVLDFSVICEANYYGSHCTTYCVSKNSGEGYYTCNSDGTKRCLSGWSNPSGDCLTREIVD